MSAKTLFIPSVKKVLSFISNHQQLKEGMFCGSDQAGIEPTQPAPQEQGMSTLTN